MGFSRTTALGYLRRAHEQHRLAHAYLISGSPGSGKQLLAAELASLVNGTSVNDVFSTKAREISDADRLQPQAANAFLKTLEEPPKDSLLLLLSALPEALPETILSRCIAIPLAPHDERESKTAEEEKLVELLQQFVREQKWDIQY